MEQVIASLIQTVVAGVGPIGALLMLAVIMLLMERKRLIEALQKKDDRIDKILSDYHAGNITLTQALESLKGVLNEIKAKL